MKSANKARLLKKMHLKMPIFFRMMIGMLILLFWSCNKQEKQKPNIIIFFTDDQGTLDAGCYGADDLHTPNIDRLSNSGIRFTRAYAHTVCCPSRSALLTGRHPQRSEINTWVQGNPHDTEKGLNMPLEEVTIAEVLKENGYRTGLFGKWHLGSSLEYGPLEQGFDTFYGHRGGFIDNYLHYFLHGRGFHDLWHNKEEIFECGKYFPTLMTEKAIEFLDETSNQPFFLFVSFNLPHYPEQPDSQFISINEHLDEPRRSYANVMSTVDDKIGQILDKVEELSLIENTLIFFMSDGGHSTEEGAIRFDDHLSGLPKGAYYGAHGGGGYTGKWRGAKGGFFEGGIRVPAIISFPGHFPENETRDQTITIMDLFPTIVEITGSKLPDRIIDGHNLLPIIESNAPSKHQILYFQWGDQWAVTEDKWKLIINGRDETWGRMESPYLANLKAENPEKENFASEHPEIIERLTNLYDIWAAEVFKNNTESK